MRSGRRWLLPLVDGGALAAFVVIGLREHHDAGGFLPLFLRNALPLEVMWFLVAVITDTYANPGFRTLVRTWLFAVPAALVVRSVWVGDPTGLRLLVFLVVGLSFTLLFLVIGRVLVRAVGRDRADVRR